MPIAMPRITLHTERPDTPSRSRGSAVDADGGDDEPASLEPISIPVIELDSSELESVREPDLPGGVYPGFTTSARSGAIAGPMGVPVPPESPKK